MPSAESPNHSETPVEAPSEDAVDLGDDAVTDAPPDDGLDFHPVELPPSQRRRAKPSLLRSTLEWAVAIGGALAVSFLVNAFLLQPFRIPSISMNPTLRVGDRVVVNKLSYKAHDVHRGDVVVFTKPSCATEGAGREVPVWANCSVLNHVDDLIKRVIAVGGDTLEIRDDHLFVNGRQLEEPYVAAGSTNEPQPIGCGFPGSMTIPKGEVFVMGDNRNHSADSRCFGPIGEKSIVGRAFVRIWSPSHLGGL